LTGIAVNSEAVTPLTWRSVAASTFQNEQMKERKTSFNSTSENFEAYQ
jgi:hypothetical protein